VPSALAGIALPRGLHSISGLQPQRYPSQFTADRVLGSEHKYRTWHLPLRCTYPPPPNLSILYPQSQRRAIPFRFSFLSVQHTSFAIVLSYGRKIVTRVHSYFTMLCLSFAIAAIHHANTAENCQIAPQLLHPTAQGTRRAGTDSSKACRQHEEESDICDSKGQKVGYSRSSTCHGCRY